MFDHIEYIKTVSECGNFTKAADKMCITQPALSIAVKKAEEELGVKLFDRNSKPVRLTEAGKIYLEAARQADVLEKQMKDQLHSTDGVLTGEIRIGAAGISMTYLIPEILEEFFQRYPRVKVEVTEESFYTLKDLLQKEEIDLIIDNEWSDRDVCCDRLFQNTVLYAISKNWIRDEAFYEKGMTAEEILENRYLDDDVEKIRVNDVLHIPFLSLQPRNELYGRAEQYFSYYRCRPETVMHFNQQLTAYRFARRGYGATFVADTLVRHDPAEELRFYLFDCPMPERWIAAAYKKNRYISNAVKALIDVTKEIYQQ